MLAARLGIGLSMSEIALAAGFGSLRRSNALFAKVYRRPPSAIRRFRIPAKVAERRRLGRTASARRIAEAKFARNRAKSLHQ